MRESGRTLAIEMAAKLRTVRLSHDEQAWEGGREAGSDGAAIHESDCVGGLAHRELHEPHRGASGRLVIGESLHEAVACVGIDWCFLPQLLGKDTGRAGTS